jgi:hypothetical protein
MDTGHHRLKPAIQARVPALLPHHSAMDTGRHLLGNFQLEGKPHHGECLHGRHWRAAVVTFFFATDGKSFVPTFNCYICNTSKCRASHLLIHLCLQESFVSQFWLRRWGPKHGRIRRGRGRVAPATTQRRDGVELYVMYLCRKTMIMYCCEDYGLSLWYICLELQLSLFCCLKLLYMCPVLEAPHPVRQPKQGLHKKIIYFLVNRGTYIPIFLG